VDSETPASNFVVEDAALADGEVCYEICADADPQGYRSCCILALYQCTGVDGGVHCNAWCGGEVGGRRTAGTRIARAFSRALSIAALLPGVACSTSSSGTTCTTETPSGAYDVPDASLGIAGGGENSVCNEICSNADPAGHRQCCIGPVYNCTREDGGVACFASCLAGGGRTNAELRADAVGDSLAHLAFLEAASVPAFARLRSELRSHGAPRSLLRSSSRARRDEVRHARTVRALARRDGAHVATPVVDPIPPRSLEAIAIENVIEGCVRETYGALVATWQSMHARDREVRGAMIKLARDETRHAALAWKVHRWIERRLDHSARTRIEDARRAAVATLRAELTIQPDFKAIRDLGLPSSTQAVALLDAITT
jgi:hypothetical protein